MESCTGGAVVNSITDIKGSSEVIKFSAVTYSNQYKIKMGVDEEIINKYSVYSMETAKEMSKKISLFTNSDYGVGITGKLNRKDKSNPTGSDNVVYISIFDRNENTYHNKTVTVSKLTRKENKKQILKIIVEMLLDVL